MFCFELDEVVFGYCHPAVRVANIHRFKVVAWLCAPPDVARYSHVSRRHDVYSPISDIGELGLPRRFGNLHILVHAVGIPRVNLEARLQADREGFGIDVALFPGLNLF